jgi:SAM-dependent methyltransferase
MQKYPSRSHVVFRRDFSKHLFEVQAILESALSGKGKAPIKYLDVGAGAGVNAIILKSLFGFDSYIIDRYDEFAEDYARDIGNEKSVTAVLESFGVKVIKCDFIKEGFPFEPNTFDAISCFDVIEHFPFSPAPFLRNLELLLKTDGKLFIGTPNQVHFFNRLKSLAGRNTWEDFEYFYQTEQNFFGHVREFTPKELAEMMRRQQHLKLETLKYSCYPLFDRVGSIKNPLLRALGEASCRFLLKPVLNLFQSLNYYIVAISRKVA